MSKRRTLIDANLLIGDSIPPRTALWSQLAALREQAAREGVLPEPLSWDGVLAESARRRRDVDD